MTGPRRVAVVTGANRGLGLAVSRALADAGLKVVMTGRDIARTAAAARTLSAAGHDVAPFQLDVTRQADVDRLAEFLAAEWGRADVLINNAGIILDGGGADAGVQMPTSPLDVPVDIVRRTMETNVFGAFRLMRALAPMMRDGGYGRIVNVSSRRGQFAAMYPPGGHPAYRASKAVLNVYTFIFHNELKDTNVLVNAVDPGWMRTDMGGPHADRSAADAAADLVRLATLPDGGPSGGFFRGRERIPW